MFPIRNVAHEGCAFSGCQLVSQTMGATGDFKSFFGYGDRNNFLDCLRAVAVFLVVTCHSGLLLGGGVGVSIFFCLSGFLIASILLHREPTWKNVGHFLFRRFMRVWPMMFTQIIATAILLCVAAPNYFTDITDYLASIPGLLTFTSPASQAYLLSRSVLWTLQAEFWFYVLMAAAVLTFGRKSLLFLAIAGIAVAWPFKLGALSVPYTTPPWALILYMDQLMTGVVCAFAVRQGSAALRISLQNRAFLWVPLTAILALATLRFRGYDYSWFFSSSAVAYLTAVIILHQWANPFKGDYEPIATLGRISYSVYLVHGVVLDFVSGHIFPHTLQFLFYSGIIVAVSMMTYRWVELPFINRSKRAPSHHSDDVIAHDFRLDGPGAIRAAQRDH